MDSTLTVGPAVWAALACVLALLVSYRIIKKSPLTMLEVLANVAVGSYAGRGVGYFLAHYPQSYDEFSALYDTALLAVTPLFVLLAVAFAVVTVMQGLFERSKQTKSNVG